MWYTSTMKMKQLILVQMVCMVVSVFAAELKIGAQGGSFEIGDVTVYVPWR